jgi:predicted Zn-dependent protease
MRRTIRWLIGLLWTAVALLALSATPAPADQHSVEAVVAALKSPISDEAAAQAREFDDKIMSSGDVEGVHVYLITDERSTRVNTLVAGLLRNAGQDPTEWVVRVLDTDPKLVNAFVVGGKYVYVYSGLLAQNPSDDELAFILSHELGHSLLKHQERQANDGSSTWAAVAGLAALFSDKNRDALTTIATAITSSYNRVDEQEADAIGCCIAHRAGYDPLRGADFFTRSMREQDTRQGQFNAALTQGKADYDQSLAACQQWQQWYNGSWLNQTPANADKVNGICQDAENKRLSYNQVVEQYNAEAMAERRNVLLSTHPQDQSRVATIAALADFLAGRRDVATLAKYQQSSRVIAALQQEGSDLLKPGTATRKATSDLSAGAAKGSLEDQLKQLQRARDQGLISQAEFERKRQEILARY